MDMTTGAMAPTRIDQRIDTLDVLRGVAICGILLMNIPFMGGIGELPTPALPLKADINWIAFFTQAMLFEGTMRGLFTMLFGAGMLLMLRRTFDPAGGTDGAVAPVDVWTRRCLALMALGLVQCCVFFWPGEILWNYGLVGFGLLAFRPARPRTLLTAAAIALVALTAYAGWKGYGKGQALVTAAPIAAAREAGKTLTDEEKKLVRPLDKFREAHHPTAKAIAAEKAERTWAPTLLAWSWGDWSDFNLTPEGWVWLLESLGFMLIGMALYRTGILTGTAHQATYTRLMLIGYPLGFAIRAGVLWWSARVGFDVDTSATSPVREMVRMLCYEPGRLLVTLGHVGLIVTLYRRGALGRAWPLRALGRMALTVYSLESIVTSILFYGFGFVGAFGFAALMGIAALIWIACGIFCVLWLRSHAMGPAEQLLRSVTYATFRRRRPEAAAALATAPAV